MSGITKIQFVAHPAVGGDIVHAAFDSAPYEAEAWESQENMHHHIEAYRAKMEEWGGGYTYCLPDEPEDLEEGTVEMRTASMGRRITYCPKNNCEWPARTEMKDGEGFWTVDFYNEGSIEAASQIMTRAHQLGIELTIIGLEVKTYHIDCEIRGAKWETWCRKDLCNHVSHDAGCYLLEALEVEYIPGTGCTSEICNHIRHPKGFRGYTKILFKDGWKAVVWDASQGRASSVETGEDSWFHAQEIMEELSEEYSKE